MSKIRILGTTQIVQTSFTPWTSEKKKAKGFILKRMPYTAYAPTKAQAQVRLAVAELGEKMEGVSDIYERIGMVRSALEGKKFTTRDYRAERREKRKSTIARLRKIIGA